MRRSRMARVEPRWQHIEPDNEEVVLLLTAAIIFTIALAALIATHAG